MSYNSNVYHQSSGSSPSTPDSTTVVGPTVPKWELDAALASVKELRTELAAKKEEVAALAHDKNTLIQERNSLLQERTQAIACKTPSQVEPCVIGTDFCSCIAQLSSRILLTREQESIEPVLRPSQQAVLHGPSRVSLRLYIYCK